MQGALGIWDVNETTPEQNPAAIPPAPIPPAPISPAPISQASLLRPAAPCLAPHPAAAPARARRAPVDCGDLPFTIRRDGTWIYAGSPIGRKELVCLFASVLKREADGGFILETPAERGRIVVEDAPFVAVELDWTGAGRDQRLSFRTNVDQIVTAGPDHPIRVILDPRTAEPSPYVLVRPGKGAPGLEARINRAVYYELVAAAAEESGTAGVWSGGTFFPFPAASPASSG